MCLTAVHEILGLSPTVELSPTTVGLSSSSVEA